MLEINAPTHAAMTAIPPMAKEVFYHPPSSTLLPLRRKSGPNGGPSLTVTIPFNFSSRLSRERSRLQGLDTPGRKSSRDRHSPRPQPPSSGRRSKTPSLPKLSPLQPLQQQSTPQNSPHRHRRRQLVMSARPSETASKSTTTNSGSLAKRAGSACCEHNSLSSSAPKDRTITVPQDLKDRILPAAEGAARGDVISGGGELLVRNSELGEDFEVEVEVEDLEVLDPEELEERRLNEFKCRQWLEGLPEKFSGMHIVQQTLYTAHR